MATHSAVTISLRDLLKIFIPMLLSFLAARLLLQTDLIFLSPLGEQALAAFAAPAKIMLIDTIIAFAIAPVASVLIAQKTTDKERRVITEQALSISLYFGISLLFLCSFIYPHLTSLMIEDSVIASLAKEAVRLMTLAIPFQLLTFTGTMILFVAKQGNRLLPMYGVSLILNAILNYLFIYYFNFGFFGAYVSTFLVILLRFIWVFSLIKTAFTWRNIIRLPGIRIIKDFMGGIGPEFARIAYP